MQYASHIEFPQRKDYPDGFSILDNPEKNPTAYLELVESSASAYYQTDFITRYFYTKRFYVLAEYLKDRTFKKSLDVGCGIGFALPLLASHSGEVVGVDASAVSVEYARHMAERRHVQNAQFLQGNILSLPCADSSFDLVVCMSVLEHIRDLGAAFKELKRVLARGGVLIVGYPSETPAFRLLHNNMSALFPKRRKIKKVIEKENPSEETFIGHINDGVRIRQELEKAGFASNKRACIKLLPPLFELYGFHILM
ncbi:MAG: type 11 methyltransferase [Parcubacteria group bacterium Gr01-1014_70]|nr:MAG: type 11 methyltransferase [Parcubacteria group bacterium Gr01-1014_70]